MIMDIIYEGFVGLGAIGKRIRSYRKHNGLKQGELAEKAGIDTNNMSRIERGVATPNLESLLKICNALGVTPNDLLLESYDAPISNLSAEVAEMLKDLTPENYRKIIEYIRFVGQSK